MLFAFLALVATSVPAPRWCSPPQVAAFHFAAIRGIVTERGAEGDLARRRYAIPAAPPDSIVLVHDEAVCERAARAYYRHEIGPIPAGGVDVVRVLDRYIVSGAIRAGEWTIVTVYSRDFAPITNIMM